MEIRKITEGLRELDFEPVSEGWNVYELSDGSILRIRPIVFKVLENRQLTVDGKTARGFAATNIVSARVLESLRQGGSVREEPTSEEKKPIEFKAIQEIWNEYAVQSGLILKVKLVVSAVVRTSKFNQFGEPVYIVSSESVADFQGES